MSTERPLRIAHFLNAFGVGGMENGVVNLINRLPPARYQSHLLCLSATGDMQARLEPGRATVACVNKRPGRDYGAIWRAAKQLRAWQVDVVHTRNWAGMDGILAARLAGVPWIVHGEHGWGVEDLHGASTKRNRIRRLLSPLVSQYLAVSGQIGAWMCTEVGLAARKISVIHNGVDLQRFVTGERTPARRQLGLAEEAFWIGSVGRLDPVKDQVRLLQAFATARQQFPQARLVLVGEGAMRGTLLSAIDRLGLADAVLLAGLQQDVRPWLQALDLFVLPSLNEGISNTILEAMATGLPVLATRVGGNPELIVDGVTGLLTPAADTDALQAAMLRYLAEPALGLRQGAAGREHCEREFSIERMVAKYDALYMRVCGRSA